jgi:cation diffusion facilitator CzcD-associated flavoprotein CzcO
VPGVDRFDGPLFHSSGWRHDVDLAGKRIAVVGTGASAIQFIPEIQPRVARLTVFQRTAPWILPRPDRPIRAGWQRLYARVPGAQRVARSVVYLSREWSVVLFRHPAAARLFEPIAARHLARQVPDAALRAALTPPYRMGCKRVLLSSTYYPALTQPNVSLITEGVAELRARSVVDTAGVEHPADAIICATGFAVTEPPIAVRLRGRAGRTLASVWQGSPAAHVGTTVSGFPNLFLLLGPNTGLGHTSVVFMIEAQIAHVLGALEWARARHVERLEPRADAQAAYVAEIDRTMRGTVWMTGGCRSWYLDATGRNSTLWPGWSWRFARRVSRFRPEEYLAA